MERIICSGVPKPNQMAGRHPMVPMGYVQEEAGIVVYQCHVCGRFYLKWEEVTCSS